MIKIRNLSHIYHGGNKALWDISLDIQPGVFGLLGPNGAGKTTFIRILVTQLKATSGYITVYGHDIAYDHQAIRAMTGYLPQSFSTFYNLRAREFLAYSASLAGIDSLQEVDRMLDQVGLADSAHVYCGKLSGGMKRRLGIAHALIGDPKLIVVDEPTAGLDPDERLRFRNMLGELASDDRTVILSTHIVHDIESACQQMMVLNEGEIRYLGTPTALIEKTVGYAWELTVPESDLDQVKSKYAVVTMNATEDGYKIHVVGEKPLEYEPRAIEPTLEHAYIRLVEHNTTEPAA